MKLIKRIESSEGCARIFINDGEFITRLFNEKDEHLVDCDSFTDDKEDAIITAEKMLKSIKPAKTDGFLNASLINSKIRFSAWDAKKGVVKKNIVRVVRAIGATDDGLKFAVVTYQGMNDFRVTAEDIREVVKGATASDVAAVIFQQTSSKGSAKIEKYADLFYLEIFDNKGHRINELSVHDTDTAAYKALDDFEEIKTQEQPAPVVDENQYDFIAFNTKRHYGDHGQRIVAVDHGTGVIFADLDRKMCEYIENCRLDKDEIMARYDSSDYGAWSSDQRERRQMLDPYNTNGLALYNEVIARIVGVASKEAFGDNEPAADVTPPLVDQEEILKNLRKSYAEIELLTADDIEGLVDDHNDPQQVEDWKQNAELGKQETARLLLGFSASEMEKWWIEKG